MRLMCSILVASLVAAPVFADDAKAPAPLAKPQAAEKQTTPIPAPDPMGYFLAPKVFRAAASNVLPSVVTIETYGGVQIGGGPAPKAPPKSDRPGTRRPPAGMQGIARPGEGPTTGLILSEDGYIITSTFNFIRKPAIITVVLHDGTQHVAKLLGQDETRKICLLKIEPPKDSKLAVPQFISTNELKVGQWSISLGVGYGATDPALSAGIISAKNRISGRAVQTDANISPANYGGPLIDLEGKVIGICVPLSPAGGAAGAGVEWYDSGIGFAVPLQGLDRLIEQMKKGETIYPGRMGIQPGQQPPKDGKGIIAAQVMPKSAADKAGVKANDVITHIDGTEILDGLHLKSVMGKYIAGDVVKATIKRGTETLVVEIKLDSGNPDVDNPTLPPPVKPEAPKPEPKTPEKTPDQPKPDAPKEAPAAKTPDAGK